MSNITLLDLLFGDYRQRVLAQLLLQPDEGFHVRELARQTGTTPGTLTRELGKLAGVGLIRRSKVGNQVRYQANRENPVFAELASLFRKTAGATAQIATALQPLADRIQIAFVFGSYARGSESAGSDINVFVLGDIEFAELVQALHPVQQSLQREISPVLYAPAEFKAKVRARDAFARELLAKPKLFLIGSEDELAEFAQHRTPARARR